jgi:hypothetical protein
MTGRIDEEIDHDEGDDREARWKRKDRRWKSKKRTGNVN